MKLDQVIPIKQACILEGTYKSSAFSQLKLEFYCSNRLYRKCNKTKKHYKIKTVKMHRNTNIEKVTIKLFLIEFLIFDASV